MSRLGAILEEIGSTETADIQQNLSVPVERVGDYVIRSLPGEYPRLETGLLRSGIEFFVDIQSDKVELEVMSSREGSGDVPAKLQNDMHRHILDLSFEEVQRMLPAAFESRAV